jgi:pSer/pThr/pTyr-binding forkhead associated (FHA) protein/EAL domain-containing protein (putative c-di-GMP-specific phosphodiesterase class I)
MAALIVQKNDSGTNRRGFPNSLVNAIGLVVPPISHSSNPPSAPRLEFFRDGSTELHRVTIERSPFRIGRCETSDLRIDSVQVSREHAQINQRGSIWIIRDLGSTNGTQVNGKLVRESFLSDGDILAIAETELTFVASSVTPFQRMATQPIPPRESTKTPVLSPSEIASMRALTEATLWQAISLQLARVVSLRSGETEACFAQLAETASCVHPESHCNAIHAVGRRYRELCRRRAIEMAQAQPTAHRIFVTADVAEFDSPEQLLADLEQLRDQIPLDCEMGVTISLPSILDPAALDDVCREVRKAELLLGCVNFQGSSGQVLELESCAPDYLMLSDSMLKGATASSQPLRRLELVLTTCQQLGIKAVLPHCACQRTIAQCRQLGYEFAVQTTPPRENVDRRNVVALASSGGDCNW